MDRNLAKVRALWTTLEAHNRSYFLSWGWIENWLTTLPISASPELAVIERDGGAIAAGFVCHQLRVRHHVLPSRVRYLNATGDDCDTNLASEYNSWLVQPGHELGFVEVLDLFPRDWDEFELPALDTSAFPGAAVATGVRGYWLEVRKTRPSPYVDLARVRGARDYLTLVSSNLRSQLRRARKSYDAQGPVVFEIAHDRRRAFQVFDELAEHHQATWTARGEPGSFASAFFRAFHHRLIDRRFDSGEIQVARLSCGGATIGCLYNFVYRDVVHFYQSGIAGEADGRRKPGLLCHVEAIAANAVAGHARYDFLAGVQRYKKSLATDENQMVWVRVQRPRARFWLEARVRELRNAWWRRPAAAADATNPATAD